MSVFARSAIAAALLVTACTAPAAEVQTPPEPQGPSGPLYVTLLGNYVGKQLHIEVDGQVMVDGRLTYPPMGAEHRYTVGYGITNTVPARVEIEGCGEIWTGDVQLVPASTAHLLIQDCAVSALAPD